MTRLLIALALLMAVPTFAADKKISEMTALPAASFADGDLFPIVDVSASETKKTAISDVTAHVLDAATKDAFTFYADPVNGVDASCDGSIVKKCKTITKLLSFCTDPSKAYMLELAAGNFTGEPTITWLSNVSMHGQGSNLNLDFEYAATPGEQASFVIDGVGINSFTLDLSAAAVALPIFQNGSYSITRTDATVGAHFVTVRNSTAGATNITGSASYTNVLFTSSADVQSGGSILCTGCILGITVDIYGTGMFQLTASTFVGLLDGHTVGLDTPTVIIDAASNQYGGVITGADVTYADDAEFIAYDPATPSYWASAPATVKEALDAIASGGLRPPSFQVNGHLTLLNGHQVSHQTTPPSTTVHANAGTSATCSVAQATDVAGSLTLVTGSAAWASGEQCKVNFDAAYALAPKCQLTATNAPAAAATLNVYLSKTTADVSINFDSADVAATTYTWDYRCDETN